MRKRKLVTSGGAAEATPEATPETPAPGAQAPRLRRLLAPASADPRVGQFAEPEARRRVRAMLQVHPALEATAFTHRPWFRGGALTGEEAQRVATGRTIRVVGIRYTTSKRVVCDACTYDRHARIENEGWDQPIYAEGIGSFRCTVCNAEFAGELDQFPRG
jgi:hypothetical protein